MKPDDHKSVCFLVRWFELQTFVVYPFFSTIAELKRKNKYLMSRLNVLQVLKSTGDGGGHMKELIQSAENTSPYVFL